MSTNRSGYSTPPMNGGSGYPGFRSQSQAPPFDRMGGGPSHLETPHVPGRRGRHSDADVAHNEFTGQDLWLASQGSNLGNLGNIGMGLSTSDTFNDPSRGRDTAQRGLETPGGYNRTPRRSASGYDEHAGSGSISAPLSPHAMYAKLELGKSHHHPWPTSTSSAGPFAPPLSSIPAPQHGRTYKTPTGSRQGSLVPGIGPHASALDNYAQPYSNLGNNFHSTTQMTDPPSPLPPFQPFSPPQVPSILREMSGEPANYISPSTLLSPPEQRKELAVEEVTRGLEGLGVEGEAERVGAKVGEQLDQEKNEGLEGKDKEAGLGKGAVGDDSKQRGL